MASMGVTHLYNNCSFQMDWPFSLFSVGQWLGYYCFLEFHCLPSRNTSIHTAQYNKRGFHFLSHNSALISCCTRSGTKGGPLLSSECLPHPSEVFLTHSSHIFLVGHLCTARSCSLGHSWFRRRLNGPVTLGQRFLCLPEAWKGLDMKLLFKRMLCTGDLASLFQSSPMTHLKETRREGVCQLGQ